MEHCHAALWDLGDLASKISSCMEAQMKLDDETTATQKGACAGIIMIVKLYPPITLPKPVFFSS